MRKILCWFLGHDRMVTSARQRVCLRCGQRETLRDYGNVRGWEERAEAVAETKPIRHSARHVRS